MSTQTAHITYNTEGETDNCQVYWSHWPQNRVRLILLEYVTTRVLKHQQTYKYDQIYQSAVKNSNLDVYREHTTGFSFTTSSVIVV